MVRALPAAALLLLAACQPGHGGNGEGKPGASIDGPTHAFAGVGANDTLRFTGTEPFWGGSVTGGSLTYSTPENPEGKVIAVTRSAGNNGLGFSGDLGGQRFDMAVSEAPCSDGMSDRTYPFTVMLAIGGDQRSGCGWTAAKPFTGGEGEGEGTSPPAP